MYKQTFWRIASLAGSWCRTNYGISHKNAFLLFPFFLLTVLVTPLPAHPISTPPIGKREEGSMVTTYKGGGTRWKADWTTEKFTDNGETTVRLTLKGQGITNPFTRDMRWETVSVWKAGSAFTPVESSTEVKDMRGKVVMTERKTVDDSTGTVSFVRQDFESGRSANKTYETDRNVLFVEGIVLALRSLPFGTDDTVKAQFLTNEPDLYNIELKQRGIEKINTPDGEIECYKVELVPKLGVLNIFKVFFPKTYFWFRVAPPHRWVRYEGFENGRSSPEVVMEEESFKESGN